MWTGHSYILCLREWALAKGGAIGYKNAYLLHNSQSCQCVFTRVFWSTRSLRQGVPPSLFLFTIVAGLSKMLQKATGANLVRSFKVGQEDCKILHLHVAYYTTIYCEFVIEV